MIELIFSSSFGAAFILENMEKSSTHPAFKYGKTVDFFESRGWQVECVNKNNHDLVTPKKGAALECIDGRHANRRAVEVVEFEGPKLPGGIDAVAALKTGGCIIGFNEAARAVAQLGYRPGTHKRCAFFELWEKGKLLAVNYKLALPELSFPGCVDHLGHWIELRQRFWGGKHFHLPGKHEEEKLIFNPLVEVTPVSRKDYFSYDHWVMEALGVSEEQAMHLVAETIEQLNPKAKRVEILIP